MSIGIKPLGARVVIEQVEVEKKTQSGIVLAEIGRASCRERV